jgi:hypothetical protein
MEKDTLEQYIDNHRDEFDVFEPSTEVWDRIVQNKPKTKVRRLNWEKVIWQAAAVIVIFMISFALQEYLHRNDGKPVADNRQERMTPEIPELIEAEIYYTSQVNSRLAEFKKLAKRHPGLETQLEHDLSELDSIYADLKDDLKDNVANEEVIDAMIQNYRIKLQILEELLFQLKQYKEKERDEENNKKYETKEYDL